MKLPKLAIEKAPFTIVMLMLLAVLGGVSYLTMPRSEDPQFEVPTIRVVAVYPGAGPEDIESLVVDPIEEEVGELQDIDQIESTIRNGVSVTAVEFRSTVSPSEASDAVDQAVSDVRPGFPDGLESVSVEAFRTSDVSIYQVALTSETAPYARLASTAEQLERAIERVGGVKSAATWAYPEQQVQVTLDLSQLRSTGLTVSQIQRALQSAGQNVPGGDAEVAGRHFNVQTSGTFESIEDIERTIVGTSDNGVVHLSDVASVRLGYEDVDHRARFNGQRAVFVTVTQRKDANIFDVLDGVRAEIDRFRPQLPGDVALAEMFDQSESVDARINGFFLNLLEGILLVGGVVLLALGLQASSIVMITIPFAIFVAIGLLDYTGYGLQQISIVGLVIALGLLVDDAIVITENVARYLRRGYRGAEAAIRATDEVGWAVVSTSATSILAFLPILLVQSSSGDFIRAMPVTVIYALVASLLLCLTLTPLLAARWLSDADDADGGSPPASPADSDASSRGGRVSGPLQRWMADVIDGPYRRMLQWSLNHTAVVLVLSVLALVGSASLFPLVGVSFFPAAEKPQFLVSVTTSEGTPLDSTDAAVRRVERLLDGRASVRRYAANVGRDHPSVYYNVIPRGQRATVGQVFVETQDPDDVPALVDDLRAELATVPGTEYDFEIFKNGPPVEAPIAIKIIGPELSTLKTLAARVTDTLKATAGTRNVDNPLADTKTDLYVDVDRSASGLLGVPLARIDRAVRMTMAGLPVASYHDPSGDDHDIVLQTSDATGPMTTLDRLSVASNRGAAVPLMQVATVDLRTEPTRIDHFNTERAVTVTADVNTNAGYSAVEVTQDVMGTLERSPWPSGYRYFVGGELEAQESSFASLLPALLAAVFGILAVLVLQFNSFRQPLIIVAAIPLSAVGAVPALLLTGYTFSFTAFVGFTSLIGIVVNNSTILVDYANQLMDAGHSVAEAVQQSSETRFTPILLTTFTTIGGLLPLTLTGSSLWSPLGWVIIGGLLVSTLLTLIVVPVLYRLLTSDAR